MTARGGGRCGVSGAAGLRVSDRVQGSTALPHCTWRARARHDEDRVTYESA
jgi:hypothetical protein